MTSTKCFLQVAFSLKKPLEDFRKSKNLCKIFICYDAFSMWKSVHLSVILLVLSFRMRQQELLKLMVMILLLGRLRWKKIMRKLMWPCGENSRKKSTALESFSKSHTAFLMSGKEYDHWTAQEIQQLRCIFKTLRLNLFQNFLNKTSYFNFTNNYTFKYKVSLYYTKSFN